MDYGIKTSRIGFDVNTASDKQLAFSSSWPLLPIEAEGDETILTETPAAPTVQAIYTHNLGYVPVFEVERVSGYPFFFQGSFHCDDTSLWFDGYVESDMVIKWKIFRRPMLTNYEAPNSDTTDATQGEDSDYGILVSLPGKDIKSTDKRDFCIRSDVRQLMVAKSGYTAEAASGLEVTHNLGYKPMYWVYVQAEGDEGPIEGEYRLGSETDDLILTASTTTLTITLYGLSTNFAYIIFKDTLTASG